MPTNGVPFEGLPVRTIAPLVYPIPSVNVNSHCSSDSGNDTADDVLEHMCTG